MPTPPQNGFRACMPVPSHRLAEARTGRVGPMADHGALPDQTTSCQPGVRGVSGRDRAASPRTRLACATYRDTLITQLIAYHYLGLNMSDSTAHCQKCLTIYTTRASWAVWASCTVPGTLYLSEIWHVTWVSLNRSCWMYSDGTLHLARYMACRLSTYPWAVSAGCVLGTLMVCTLHHARGAGYVHTYSRVHNTIPLPSHNF